MPTKKKDIKELLTQPQPNPFKPIETPKVETPKTEPFNPKTPTQEVKFSKQLNQPVEVTPTGGNKETLSQAEYKTLLGEGGYVSPAVERLRQASEKDTLRRQIDTKLRQGATIQQITQELLQGQQKPITPQMQPVLSQTPKTKVENNKYSPDSFPNKVAQTFGIDTPQEKVNLKGAAKLVTTPIGKLYDFAQSIFSGGKGIEQKEAEATFTDIKQSFAQDLNLVEAGLKNPYEVTDKIRRAREANSQLASSIKGLNTLNLRYFVLHGRDVQAQIIENEEFLKDMENLLISAQQKGQIAEQQQALKDTQTGYGLK